MLFLRPSQSKYESPLPLNYRRAIRYPCHLIVVCQPSSKEERVGEASAQEKDACPAKVADLSQNGIALLLKRRFEPETVLEVNLQSPEESSLYTLPVRVIRVSPKKRGNWLTGCVLLKKLSDNEVKFLV